jgi:hypothetical protein
MVYRYEYNLVGDDKALLQGYKNLRNFKQSLAFWATLVERKTEDPYRSYMLAIVPRVQALSSQRDEVIHRLWGGGMEAESPSSAGLETADAGLMPNPGEKLPSNTREGLIPFTWKATFQRLRRLATDLAQLNRDLLQSVFLPSSPHGYVDTTSQVDPR